MAGKLVALLRTTSQLIMCSDEYSPIDMAPPNPASLDVEPKRASASLLAKMEFTIVV